MKRKFSKVLSVTLVVVMLMSFIQLPAFAAAPVFKDAALMSKSTWIVPYGDEVFHFNFAATDGDNPVTYEFYSNIKENDFSGANIDAQGIYTVNFRSVSAEKRVMKVKAKSGGAETQTQLLQYKDGAPYIYDFDDDPYAYSSGTNKIYEDDSWAVATIENVQMAVDPDKGNYIKPYTGDTISFTQSGMPRDGKHTTTTVKNSTILSADVKLSSTTAFDLKLINTSIFNWDPTTHKVKDMKAPGDTGTFSSVTPGWHSIKVMFDNFNDTTNYETSGRSPKRYYAIFFDDELLSPSASEFSLSDTAVIKFTGSEGVDNFKYYGSSTPHAYNVALESAPRVGSTVNGSASMFTLPTNERFYNETTGFVYSYSVSDTVDSSGTYTKVESTNPSDPLFITSEGKLMINGDYEGHYIKVSARATSRGGMSPEVESKLPPQRIGTYDTTYVTKGTSSKDARFRLAAPFAGELQWRLISSTFGDDVTLTNDGLITITSEASGSALLKVTNPQTGDTRITNLEVVENSIDESALSEVIEPVMFKADIDLSDTTTITAGGVDFTVTSAGIGGVPCSDGATFKFVVEDDVYYAFADDTFISSDAFTSEITSITTNGPISNYYAGSPLVYDGTFLYCTIVDACESNWIEAPVFEFYNESGVYPESYSYKWYIDGTPVSTSERFYIPGGSSGKSIYCEVIGVTDNQVVGTSNTLSISSQYNLSISSPGDFTVSLNTTDKDVYLFIVGEDKTVFVADMSDGDPVHAVFPGSVGYNMFFVYKNNLAPRGIATYIPANTTTYSDTVLPAGARSNLVILTRNSDIGAYSSGASLFEDPVAYADLSGLMPDGGRADLSLFICDAYIAPSTATSYADFANQPEGFYNIISIDDAGVVTETATYNNLYMLFANSANYEYSNFEYIAQKALSLEDDEIQDVLQELNGVAHSANVAALTATNATHFPASVFLQSLSEQAVPSDASVASFEKYLKKAGLSTDVVKLIKITNVYGDAIDTIVASDGLVATNNKLKNYMILSEVASGYSDTNVHLALSLLGSSTFNNAKREPQDYAVGVVAKKSYANVGALKTAVETAVSAYKPQEPNNNENNRNDTPSSTVTITGPVVPVTPVVPVVPAPASRFNDAPESHWAYEYIEKMASANVLNGYNGAFRPDDDITRAEFVKVLCSAFGIEAKGEVSFTDVSSDSWYAPYVNALASNDIAKGDEGMFRPDDKISRQDAAVLIERVLKHVGINLADGEITFTDADAMSDYAKNAIASLAKAGVINGMEDGSYAPINNITRAQVAKLICVAIELGGDK